MISICLNCGSEFESFKSRHRKFCCNSCSITYSNKHRKLSESTKIKIGLANKGTKPNRFKKRLEIKCALSDCNNTWFSLESQIGKKYCSRKCRNIALKEIMSEHMKNSYRIGKINNSGVNNRAFGKPSVFKHHTLEAKQKIRESRIKQIEKDFGICYPQIGRNETQLLNEQEHKDKCKIQRQYHVKGLGYVVDGYCSKTNTVYEVYEKRHQLQFEHDLLRQNEITEFLKCNFKIIWEN
jgi:very-short-patch-repair endonuclease/endogenous inhibitor of DNA gyrase (YacG/DUF329 family)